VGLSNASFVASKIIENKLSVRQTENFVKIFKKKFNKSSKKDVNISDMEKILSEKIGLNVIIKANMKNKGSITFLFKELDQLNRIIEVIKLNY